MEADFDGVPFSEVDDEQVGFTNVLITRERKGEPSLRETLSAALRAARWRSVAAVIICTLLSVTFALVGTLTFWADSLTWRGWVTLYSLVAMISSLVLELWDVSLTFFSVNLFLLLVKIISIQEALAGFSSESIVSIGTIYIITAGIEKTKLLDWLVRVVLRKPANLRVAFLRILPAVALLSAFVNNTPIVAVMIPVLGAWSIRANLAVSQLLMPMSFSVTLGGLCTILGTSTNLVIQGLAGPNIDLGFFQVGALGGPFAIIGLCYIVVFAQYLLPAVTKDQLFIPRVYAWHLVEAGSYHIGTTLQSSSTLARVAGAELVWMKPVEDTVARSVPDLKAAIDDLQEAHLAVLSRPIKCGDMLLYVGVKECVFDMGGLKCVSSEVSLGNLAFFEMVLAESYPPDDFIRLTDFEKLFACRVRLIVRHGITQHRAKEILKQDVVVVEARYDILHFGFDERFESVREVRAVEPLEPNTPIPLLRRMHPWIVLVVLVSIIAVNAAGILLLYEATGVGTIVLLVTGVLTWKDVLQAIPGNILLMTAFSFPLAAAMQNSGVAALLGESMAIAFSVSEYVQLLGVYIACNFLTAIAANAAAAAIMFPIVISLARAGRINVFAGLYIIMIASSADFLTPFGVETNLMVKQPGGYKFGDYSKFGLPLTVLGIALCPGLAVALWPVSAMSNETVYNLTTGLRR